MSISVHDKNCYPRMTYFVKFAWFLGAKGGGCL
jgi:hypothetical protein